MSDQTDVRSQPSRGQIALIVAVVVAIVIAGLALSFLSGDDDPIAEVAGESELDAFIAFGAQMPVCSPEAFDEALDRSFVLNDEPASFFLHYEAQGDDLVDWFLYEEPRANNPEDYKGLATAFFPRNSAETRSTVTDRMTGAISLESIPLFGEPAMIDETWRMGDAIITTAYLRDSPQTIGWVSWECQ